MDGTASGLSKTALPRDEPISLGACENCQFNFDCNRTHAPVTFCPDTHEPMVKCLSQAPNREIAKSNMILAQLDLSAPQECQHYAVLAGGKSGRKRA
jgi:hypothetical protein